MMKNFINDKNKRNRIKNVSWKWSIKILFLSLALSISFSIISEMVLNGASITISILIIIAFLIINVISDMVGVAITAGNIEDFEQLSKDNITGAREGVVLLKNADKISVLCCDIIGDICGILSGACGASILLKVVVINSDSPVIIILSALISGIIAGLTIFFKSIEKGYALNKSRKIILWFGKIINFINKKN